MMTTTIIIAIRLEKTIIKLNTGNLKSSVTLHKERISKSVSEPKKQL